MIHVLPVHLVSPLSEVMLRKLAEIKDSDSCCIFESYDDFKASSLFKSNEKCASSWRDYAVIVENNGLNPNLKTEIDRISKDTSELATIYIVTNSRVNMFDRGELIACGASDIIPALTSVPKDTHVISA